MSFPNLTGFLQMSAEKDEKMYAILAEFDELVKKYGELKASTQNIAEQVESLEIDAELCRQVADNWQENMKKRQADYELAMECYDTTLELTNIIKNMDLSKITKCDVLEKQMSKQNDWHVKEQLFQRIHEQHKTMEDRQIVRDLRMAQKENLEATKALEQSNLEISQLKEHWDEKINDVKNQRNDKIVNLVKGSKELIALREKKNIPIDETVRPIQATAVLGDIAIEAGDDNLANSFRFFPSINNFFEEFKSSINQTKENISNQIDEITNLMVASTPISQPPNSIHNSTVGESGSIRKCSNNNIGEPVAKKKVHFQHIDSKHFVPNLKDTANEVIIKKSEIVSEEDSSKSEQLIPPGQDQVEKQQQEHNATTSMDGGERVSSNEEEDYGAVTEILPKKPKIISNVLLKAAQLKDPEKSLSDDESKIDKTLSITATSSKQLQLKQMEIEIDTSNNQPQSNNAAVSSIPTSYDIFKNMFPMPTANSIVSEDSTNNNAENEENNSSLNFEDAENNLEAEDFFFDFGNNDDKADVNNSYL